jgi:hypothetical protein
LGEEHRHRQLQPTFERLGIGAQEAVLDLDEARLVALKRVALEI